MNIDLRVNGQQYPEVTRLYAIEDGRPGGNPEIVVRDPTLGEFTLTENCGMEIMDDRCGVWCPGSLDRLTGIVELPSMPRKYPPGLRRNTSERISRVRRLR